MASIKSFVKKIKQKNTEYKLKQDEKKAESKGFSSAKAYSFYSNTAKSRGEEKAKATLRKKELKRIEDEAKQETMMELKTGKYSKVQRKVQKGFESFQKGAGMYNEVMGGLKSLGSSNDSFYPTQNSRQAYASGYGAFKPQRRKSSKPKSKTTSKKKSSKSKPKQQDFWSQFY